jgi:predicted neuraminidase
LETSPVLLTGFPNNSIDSEEAVILNIHSSEKTFVFTQPQAFTSCHASTIVLAQDNSLLCAWFGGSSEGADDAAIWVARQTGGKWSKPVRAADVEGIPLWNPVLFRFGTDRIMLFYKTGKKIPEWYTLYTVSYDNGLIWTEPRELVPGDRGGRGPVKNKPICLRSGRILAPASIEGETWDAFVDISDNGGLGWKKSGLVPVQQGTMSGKGIIQPSLWQSENGQVHMFLRSTEGKILRSDSNDEGETWGAVYETGLPNNNSGLDLAEINAGNLALVYNPVSQNRGPRTPLWLAFSHDDGKSWETVLVLEKDPGEYSYPAIIADNNNLYITYTWKRTSIAFWKIWVE